MKRQLVICRDEPEMVLRMANSNSDADWETTYTYRRTHAPPGVFDRTLYVTNEGGELLFDYPWDTTKTALNPGHAR